MVGRWAATAERLEGRRPNGAVAGRGRAGSAKEPAALDVLLARYRRHSLKKRARALCSVRAFLRVEVALDRL